MTIHCFVDQGRIIDPFTYTGDDLCFVDVARRLSRIARFTGGGDVYEHPLSVAQHCVVLADMVPARLRLAALLHDVPEIFFGEIPSPVKHQLVGYEEMEDRAIRHLGEVMGVPYEDFLEIKPYDKRLAKDEAASIFSNPQVDVSGGFGITVPPLPAVIAEQLWLCTLLATYLEADYE